VPEFAFLQSNTKEQPENSEKTAKDLAVFSVAEPSPVQDFCGERDAAR
jgi:cobalamin biosynthesis protein CbiG